MGKIILPPSVQNSSAGRDVLGYGQNHLEQFEHAKAYAPGGGKRFTDTRVAALNQELDSLAGRSKQTVFAVWHEPNQALKNSRAWGVIIWATNAFNDRAASPIGNVTFKKNPDGSQTGQADIQTIMKWCGTLASLVGEENARLAQEKYEAMFDEMNKPLDDARERAAEDERANAQDAVLSQVFQNTPTRSDRTISVPSRAVDETPDVPPPAPVPATTPVSPKGRKNHLS